jgi:hypothetical protein
MTPSLFRFVSWIPLGVLLTVQLYARGFDGWGRWATAPLFLLPISLSFALVLVGLHMCRSEHEAGLPVGPTVAATLLAGAPALWFTARALLA